MDRAETPQRFSNLTNFEEPSSLTERTNPKKHSETSINRTPKSNISQPGKIFENSQTRGASNNRDSYQKPESQT